jgi:hypothetical protein
MRYAHAQKYEMRFIPNESSKDLQQIIGMDAYLEAVKHASAHPLLADLVQSNAPLVMGASDIIFALRKIADGCMSQDANEMVTRNVYKHAVQSVAYPIAAKYADQMNMGISPKEEKAAMSLYHKSCNKIFDMLSPGTTEVAKTLPRFTATGKLKTVETIKSGWKSALTPTLPKVMSRAAANINQKSDQKEQKEQKAGEGAAAQPKAGEGAAAQPAPKAVIEKKATRAAGKKSDSPDVPPAGASRKSALGIKGSPKKNEEDDEEDEEEVYHARKKPSPKVPRTSYPARPPTSSTEARAPRRRSWTSFPSPSPLYRV